jgi:hypothetical protein
MTKTIREAERASGSKVQQGPSDINDLASIIGLTPEQVAALREKEDKKEVRSGVFTRTYDSVNVPSKTAIREKINDIFQKYYGRDANEYELAEWLPALQERYKDPKTNRSKTVIKEIYDKGRLVSTEYLTADGANPSDWLENQVQTRLASGNVAISGMLGVPEGPAGKYYTAVKNLAYDNGVALSDSAAMSYATKIVAGQLDENTAFSTIRESASNAFPAYADKIKAGIDLKTLADPYIQSMSNILEIPSSAIDLFDPKVRSAMSFTLPDGKVGAKSIYDFEKELRQDDRWQYTNQARKEVADVTLKVLRDFGFTG